MPSRVIIVHFTHMLERVKSKWGHVKMEQIVSLTEESNNYMASFLIKVSFFLSLQIVS